MSPYIFVGCKKRRFSLKQRFCHFWNSIIPRLDPQVCEKNASSSHSLISRSRDITWLTFNAETSQKHSLPWPEQLEKSATRFLKESLEFLNTIYYPFLLPSILSGAITRSNVCSQRDLWRSPLRYCFLPEVKEQTQPLAIQYLPNVDLYCAKNSFNLISRMKKLAMFRYNSLTRDAVRLSVVYNAYWLPDYTWDWLQRQISLLCMGWRGHIYSVSRHLRKYRPFHFGGFVNIYVLEWMKGIFYPLDTR